jgi:hypothetical protein
MRRKATVVIEREGRDKGGVFVIHEMPALPATEWFLRAMQLLARSGADVPPDIFSAGPAGFVTLGIGTVLTGLGKAPWFEVKPLLDELLECVESYQPSGGTAPLTSRAIIFGQGKAAGQVQEGATVLQLYEEVVSLHLGFSMAARLLTFRQLAGTMIQGLTPNTETSTGSAEPLSQAGSPVS